MALELIAQVMGTADPIILDIRRTSQSALEPALMKRLKTIMNVPAPTPGASDNILPVQCLRAVFSEVMKLSELLAQQRSYELIPVLRILSCGLDSKHPSICLWSCRILARLIHSVSEGGLGPAVMLEAYQWFITNEGSIGALLTAFALHPKLHAAIFSVLEQISQSDVHHFVNVFMNQRIPEKCQYFTFVHDFIEFLRLSASSKTNIQSRGLPTLLIQDILMASDKMAGVEQRLAGFTLGSTLCIQFTDIEQTSFLNFLSILKKGCHDRHLPIRVTSYTCLSVLLEALLERNPTIATELYKFQVFVMIEYHRDENKSFFQKTLTNFMEKHSKVPINLIVEPFLKTLLLNKYDNLDLEVLYSIAKHPTLDVQHASKLFSYLWTIATTDLIFSRLSTMIIVILINRFYKRMLSDLDRSIESALKSSLLPIADVSKMTFEQDYRVRIVVDLLATFIYLMHDEVNAMISRWLTKMPQDRHPAVKELQLFLKELQNNEAEKT